MTDCTGDLAEVLLDSVLRLTGRGWVCIGEIRSGHVNSGYWLWLPGGEVSIRAIEFVDRADRRPLIGFVLADCAEDLLAELTELAASGATVSVASYRP